MIDVGKAMTDAPASKAPFGDSTSTETSRKYRLDLDNSENYALKKQKAKPSQTAGRQDLGPEELHELVKLKQRDREVKAHEQAHIAAGGTYVRSGARLQYEKGPDGRNYAVEGEVQIDTSEISGDPQATIRKMQIIRSAALAPAAPSPQDRRVAAEATRIENQTRHEMLIEKYSKVAALETGNTEPLSEAPKVDGNGITPAISLGGLIDLVS